MIAIETATPNNVSDCLALIPARGGSKGIPGKNIKDFLGKPLDPWVFYDKSYGGWSFLPPYSAIVFGRLIALVRDLHVAHYLAVLLSVLLIGFTLRGFFRRAPFQLGNFGATVAAITFIKVPWLGSGILSFPFHNVIQANVMPFLLGRPSGAFTDTEAGLFTYFPYVGFLVLIWSTCFSGRRRVYLATGLVAGFLIYVYYYHSTSPHKFLFGHHSNRLSDDIRMRIETTSWKEFENSDRRLPKIDIIYGVLSDKDRALQRISKRFDILQSIEGDQDWAVRVRDRVGQ